MLRIKVRVNGKWTVVDKFEDEDKWKALDAYNGAPTPKMLISNNGVVHKQYTDNAFIYVGRR
jgi:hypothetical protein